MPYNTGIGNVKGLPVAGTGTTAQRTVEIPYMVWVNRDDPANPVWQQYDGNAWIDFSASAPTLPAWALAGNALPVGTNKLGSTNAVAWDIRYNDVVNAVVSSIMTWKTNHEWRNIADTVTTLLVNRASGSVESVFRFRVLQDATVTNNQRITVYNINQLINGSSILCGGIECGTTFFGSRGDTGGAIIRPAGNTFALVTSVGTRVSLFDMANMRWKITDQGDAAITVNSGLLDLDSVTKAFYPPRMTTAQRDAMPNPPVAGAVIYNTTTNKHQGYDGAVWNDFY